MTEEEIDSGETKKGHKDTGKGRANGNNDEHNSSDVDNKGKDDERAATVEEDNLDPEERERRDKEERIAASLKKREAEVAKEVFHSPTFLDIQADFFSFEQKSRRIDGGLVVFLLAEIFSLLIKNISSNQCGFFNFPTPKIFYFG